MEKWATNKVYQFFFFFSKNTNSFVGQLLAGPFWGMLSDRYHTHRTIIVITNLMSCVTMGCQPFVSLKYGNPATNRCPYPDSITATTSGMAFTFNLTTTDMPRHYPAAMNYSTIPATNNTIKQYNNDGMTEENSVYS